MSALAARLRALLSWRLIGPAVVVLAIVWAGPVQVWRVLSAADLRVVGAALALAIPLALIKGIRWRALLAGGGVSLSLRESTSMYAMGMTLGAVTPGRLGDFAKVIPLRRHGCPIGRGIAYSLLDRLLDVAFVLLAGYAGLWYFSQRFTTRLWTLNLIAAGALLCGLLAFTRRALIMRLALRLVPSQHHPAFRQCVAEVSAVFRGRSILRGLLLAGLTVGFWFVQFYAVYLCSVALSLDIPFIFLTACVAVVTVASFVPITIAGAGTRDALFILLLAPLGVGREQSVALSSLVLAVFLCNCVVFYLVSMALGRPGIPKGSGEQLAEDVPCSTPVSANEGADR